MEGVGVNSTASFSRIENDYENVQSIDVKSSSDDLTKRDTISRLKGTMKYSNND